MELLLQLDTREAEAAVAVYFRVSCQSLAAAAVWTKKAGDETFVPPPAQHILLCPQESVPLRAP